MGVNASYQICVCVGGGGGGAWLAKRSKSRTSLDFLYLKRKKWYDGDKVLWHLNAYMYPKIIKTKMLSAMFRKIIFKKERN